VGASVVLSAGLDEGDSLGGSEVGDLVGSVFVGAGLDGPGLDDPVGAAVDDGVGDAVGDGVGVAEGVGVFVGFGVLVGAGVLVGVGVLVGAGVGDGVLVACGSGSNPGRDLSFESFQENATYPPAGIVREATPREEYTHFPDVPSDHHRPQ